MLKRALEEQQEKNIEKEKKHTHGFER